MMNIRLNKSITHVFTMLCILVLSSCESTNNQGIGVPEVKVVQVIKKDVPIKMEFVGQVYGLYDIPIRARVEGYLEGRFFNEGMPVKRGQLLYKIDPQPFEAAVAEKLSNLAVAQTNLVYAENDLQRIEPLAKRNAVSQSELDGAIASRDASRSTVKAAQASLNIANIQLSYTELHSPINGIIGKTQARIGEFVGRDPNPVILNTVSRIDTIRVQFFITESDYLAFARQAREKLDSLHSEELRRKREPSLDLILSDGSIHKYKGSLDFIDREVDASTGAILLQASFPNPEKLVRPGQYAKIKASVTTIKDALLIPMRSVMELQGQFSVYVVNDSSMVEARQIIVGEKIDDMWLITEGINADDKIVFDGLQKIRSGMKVKAKLSEFKSQAKP
jgi:membrane fusion protein, multidrug efflux system